MAIWNQKRNELRDRHREFIYLDEVSVISLLAGLQGEIKTSVTDALSRTKESSLRGTLSNADRGASLESSLGASKTSTSEVVRRAVVQSTFRDLWRRDVGVLLHDISGTKRRYRKRILSSQELERALPRLKKAKLAVPLNDIKRGDIVELDVKLEADRLFNIITLSTTLLNLMDGRENLFGASSADIHSVTPMIEVLREFLVGLVPMRGLSTSHSVIEVSGEQIVIATELLGDVVRKHAKPLELVGFAEANSFWRDLRRTLFSGVTFTAYARAEGPALSSPWSPIKIADLLASVSPDLRDEVVLPLQKLDLGHTPSAEVNDEKNTAHFRLVNFAAALESVTGANPDPALVAAAITASIPALASAATIEERRRAFESVAQAVAGDSIDRNLLLKTRSEWIDQTRSATNDASPDSTLEQDSEGLPIQLEVGFVALYW